MLLFFPRMIERRPAFGRLFRGALGCVVGLGCGLGAVAADAQPSDAPRVRALAFDTPPQIDGRLDDPAWGQGDWHEGFTRIDSPDGGEDAAVATRFKIGFDGRSLYLAVRMDQPEGVALVATDRPRDTAAWQDDAVEFMVNPDPAADQYNHIIVNAAGALFDAWRIEDGFLVDTAFQPLVQRAVDVGETGWTLEMAVPLADLGLTAQTGEEWAFNVARSSHATGTQAWSSFAPMGGGNLHQPKKFARLTMEGIDTTPFLWAVQAQGSSRSVMRDDRLTLETSIRVTNQTDRYQFFELQTSVMQDGEPIGRQEAVYRGLDAGATRQYSLHVPYDGEGEAIVAVDLRGAESGALWRRLQYAAELRYTPIDIAFTKPSYRDSIYATQDLDSVEGTIHLNLPASALDSHRLTISLQSPGGESLASTTPEALQASMSFALPLPEAMPFGDYQVVADLQDTRSQKSYRNQRRLAKLPPPEHGREVRLDANRVTRVDGEAFVPFGAFSIRPHEDLEVVGRQGYTAVLAYRFHVMTDEQRQTWLDRVHAAGMMASFGPWPRQVPRDPKRMYTPEEEEVIRQYVRRWSQHPAFLAWYLDDEPEIRGTLPQRMERLYQIVREADPYHPAIMLNVTTTAMQTYGGFSDILMPDPYPGFYQRGGTRRPMAYLYNFIRTAEQSFGRRLGTWATPQAFNWADYSPSRHDERAPNLLELRNMLYQVVSAKGTGVIWYTYMSARHYPDIRMGLGFLARETRLLRDAIVAVDTAAPLRTNLPETDLLVTHRQVDGQHYVFAINLLNETLDARIQLPREAPESWHVMSEGRTVGASGRVIAETFAPFATHVYTTDAEAAGRLSLQAAQERIADAPLLERGSVQKQYPLPAEEVEFSMEHGW